MTNRTVNAYTSRALPSSRRHMRFVNEAARRKALPHRLPIVDYGSRGNHYDDFDEASEDLPMPTATAR
jgi:hypothetical protein